MSITALSLAVVFGGITRIARVCSLIVPFMALAYLGIGFYDYGNIPQPGIWLIVGLSSTIGL